MTYFRMINDRCKEPSNYTKSNNEYRLLFWQHFCDDIVNFIEYRRKIYFTENRYSEVGESFDYTAVTRIGLRFFSTSGNPRTICLNELSFVKPML